MSLQIWMPLHTNIKNQGLTSASTILSNVGNGIGFNAEGKTNSSSISVWYNGSGVILSSIMRDLSTYNTYSIACWIYLDEKSAGHSATIISSGNWNYAGNHMCFALYDYNSGYQKLLVPSLGDWNTGISLSTPIELKTWYHITITYDQSQTRAYINGQYAGAYNGGGITPNYGHPDAKLFSATYADSYTLKGRINDFRIYDHCLSIREIKELAKGLVCHYKLDQNKPATNLITNSTFSIYNNYSSNISASITATGEQYQGAPVYRLTMSALNETGLSNIQSNLWGTGIYTRRDILPSFLANTKYCYWLYYRPVWPHENVRVGGTASNIGGWTEISPHYYRDGWYRVGQYRDGTVTADKTDAIYTSFYCSTVALHQPISIDFCCPHLIEGYDYIMEEDGYLCEQLSEEYDVSGNGGLGWIEYQKPIIKSTDSPRYSGSYELTEAYMRIGSSGKVRDAITINIWAKMDNWSEYSSQTMRMFSCTESGGWCLSSTGGKFAIWMGVGESSNSYFTILSNQTISSLSGWHMFTITYDGYQVKFYIDGQLDVASNPNGSKIPIYYNQDNGIFIGAEASGNPYTFEAGTIFKGKLSDFRIYGTALVEEDILELYKTGAIVDNLGNIYSGEFVEVDI